MQLESQSSKCAKLHTVAARNNRDHLTRSFYSCLRHIDMGFILCAHPVHGDLHIKRNVNREIATIPPPFYNRPHQLHVLFVKAATGMTFPSSSQHHFVVIGKPEREVYKASHCGSKQQQRSPDAITLFLLVGATCMSVWVLFFTHIPFVVNRTSNAMSTERLQQHTWISAGSLSQV